MSKRLITEKRNEILTIVMDQTRETVVQEAENVTIRMATMTCPCGWKRGVVKMYQCLYCNIWFCTPCAESHFGKTVQEHRRDSLPLEDENE